ncbi:MAG: EamA family transporter [Saprospiraceae bacterium]|nr:EamA family transporter [Saprospiraceae bacterium]
MKEYLQNKTVLSWVLLLVLSLTWGSSYILIKRGLVAFQPLQVASIRLVVSAMAFIPLLIILKRKITWKNWKLYFLVGLTGNAIPALMFAIAQTQLSSALTGVLNSVTPLATFVIGFLIFRLPFKWHKLLGVVVGLGGAFIIKKKRKASGAASNPFYAGFVLVAAICYAISSNTVASFLKNYGSIEISGASFVMISPLAIFLFWYSGVMETTLTHPSGWSSFGYISILALAGTVFASILFYKLVHLTGAVFSSFVSYLMPIVATMWGLLDGEPITLLSLSGMVLILLGVYVARK